MAPPAKGDTYGDAVRAVIPDELYDGTEAVLLNADLIEGENVRLDVSLVCANAGIAQQARTLGSFFLKATSAQAGQNPWKSLKLAVDDRCVTFHGDLPISMFNYSNNTATCTGQSPQTPHDKALCELTESYLKGYHDSLTHPADQLETGRKLFDQVSQRRQEHAEHPNDAKLNDAQRMALVLNDIYNIGFHEARHWQDASPEDKANEEEMAETLVRRQRVDPRLGHPCPDGLEEQKAAPELLKIAADRAEKDNADRSEACLALGIVGDMSMVPDLVSLTYHYNRDTRFAAQIALVRLTGENFGRDVAAWSPVVAGTGRHAGDHRRARQMGDHSPVLQAGDPKTMEKDDGEMAEMAKRLASPDIQTGISLWQDAAPDTHVAETGKNDLSK